MTAFAGYTQCPRPHCGGSLYRDDEGAVRCLLCCRPLFVARVPDLYDVLPPALRDAALSAVPDRREGYRLSRARNARRHPEKAGAR